MIINKNTKIFLAIFSSLLLVVTIVAIVYKNNNKESDESQIIIESAQKIPEISDEEIYEQNNAEVLGATLNDTYSNNGLKYKYVNDDSKDVPVTYVKVSGLKNEIVEESINSQISEKVNKIINSNNFKDNSDDNAYIDMTVESNFSDVLSIKIFAKFNENFDKCYGLNFRLDNGDKIKFNDLFVFNAPKKNIITTSAYRSLALNYYTNEGVSNEFYTNIEDDLISFVRDYNNGKVTEYSFTPLSVELYRDGKIVVIDMTQYYQYIDIYNKFVSSANLYEGNEGVATKIPVFVNRPTSIADLYEKVNDYCVLDVIIYSDEEFSSKELSVIDNYKKTWIKDLNELKKEKGLYYSNYIKVTKANENGESILVFNENECYVKVDESKFVNDVYSKIILAERDINNLHDEKSKIYVLDDKLLSSATGERKYSINTGKEIEDVEELVIEEVENEVEESNSLNENESMNNPTEQVNINENNDVQPSASPSPSTETNNNSTSTTEDITTQVYF